MEAILLPHHLQGGDATWAALKKLVAPSVTSGPGEVLGIWGEGALRVWRWDAVLGLIGEEWSIVELDQGWGTSGLWSSK